MKTTSITSLCLLRLRFYSSIATVFFFRLDRSLREADEWVCCFEALTQSERVPRREAIVSNL